MILSPHLLLSSWFRGRMEPGWRMGAVGRKQREMERYKMSARYVEELEEASWCLVVTLQRLFLEITMLDQDAP